GAAATASHADVIVSGAPPNVAITRIHPNIGTEDDPEVRVERVRRSSGDSGLINFETDFRNDSGQILELTQLRTFYFGGAAMPSGVFDAFDNADLLRLDIGGLGNTGTVIDEDS